MTGFAGYGLSVQLSDVEGDTGIAGSDLSVQNSHGLKAGYFLDNLKYFGGEAKVYMTTPYLKR